MLVFLIICVGFSDQVQGSIYVSGEFVIQNFLRWNYTDINPMCMGPDGGRNPCEDIRICKFAAASIAMGGWPTLCGWVENRVPKVCCGLPLVLGPGLMKKINEENSRHRACGTTTFVPKSKTSKKFFDILQSLPETNISDATKFDPPLYVNNMAMLIPPVYFTGSKQGNFPWMVSVRKDGHHICGGSLIDRKHILTAAHCVLAKADKYTIHVGNLYVDDGYAFNVSKIAIHPEYKKWRGFKNMAILTLSEDILIPQIAHICLIHPCDADSDNTGINTTLLRWGKISNNDTGKQILLIIDDLPVVPIDECLESYRLSGVNMIPDELKDNFICTRIDETDSKICEKDFGGPLMYTSSFGPSKTHILIGLDTFGPMCGGSNFLALYTKITTHEEWIMKTMKE